MTMQPRRVYGTALALGLCAGLVEGAAMLWLQSAGWLGWRIARVPVGGLILVIAPVCAAAVFLATAGMASLLSRVVAWAGRPPAPEQFSFAACGFLLWFDWLMVPGRLRLYAIVPLAIGLAAVMLRWHRSRPTTAWTAARRAMPWLVLATVLASAATHGRGWALEELAIARLSDRKVGAPNVLVVVLDTVRADHVSAYGYPRPTSRFLDQLANDGVLFERAYSTSSWTLPAHASLLTGLLPQEHGATVARLEDRTRTLGELLRSHGYRTAAFSANLEWFTRQHGFGRGFITFGDFDQTIGDSLGRTLYGRLFDEFIGPPLGLPPLRPRLAASDINRFALDWLDRHTATAPSFVVLNYFDAHGPYEPPQPFRGQFSSHASPGGLLKDKMLRRPPNLTGAQLQDEIDAYDGAIAYLDNQLCALLEELDRRQLLGNTLIVVTSDHGESFGEHGLFTHRTALYHELIHVPLILHWPGHLQGKQRIAVPVSIADVPATIADLLDLTDHGLDPLQSLALAWEDPIRFASRRYPVQSLARMPFDEFNWVPAYYGAMRSVVTARWHYIEHETQGDELYDLEQDPEELVNLIGTPDGLATARVLADYLGKER